MADDQILVESRSTGTPVATDKIGAKHFQKVKLADVAGDPTGVQGNPAITQLPTPGTTGVKAVDGTKINEFNLAGAGVLRELIAVVETGAASAFLHIKDKATALAVDDVPDKCLPLQAPGGVYTPINGFKFTNGLAVGRSTTQGKYTDPGDDKVTWYYDLG